MQIRSSVVKKQRNWHFRIGFFSILHEGAIKKKTVKKTKMLETMGQCVVGLIYNGKKVKLKNSATNTEKLQIELNFVFYTSVMQNVVNVDQIT